MANFLGKNKNLLFLLIILAIASFFRLWQLDNIPPGLYPDVAINGNDALDSLKTGNFKVFYPENNGREGLFMWLIALSFSVFGASVWSIKIVAAAVGILTVLGLYLLTRQLFLLENSNLPKASKVEIVALLSSFFLAISFWHTNFSRIGFRAILLPFILVFAFYFLFRGYRQKKVLHFIISGIFLGLGFYTYISYRFIILLLPLVLIFWWLAYRKQNLQKRFLLLSSYLLLTTIIVALPIGIYFLQNPHDFIGRAAPISVFAAENPLKEFGKSLILHLGMFNFHGDQNWRHNFAGSPALSWPTGILFLIGLAFSIQKFLNSLKNKDYPLLASYCLLISWFFIMLLPGILTYEGVPHFLRVVGAIPVVYIFVGFGAWKIYEIFNRNIQRKKILFSAVILFLLAVSVFEFNKYFFVWAQKPEVKDAFSANYVEIGNYLNSLPPDTKKYVVVNQSGVPVPWPDGLPMPAQAIMFIESAKYGNHQSEYLLPENLNQITINKKPIVIIPLQYNQDLFNELLSRFPEGETKEENGIWMYEIK